MLALLLNIITGVIFGNIMKLAAQQRANLFGVAAWNYLTATVVCCVLMVVQRPTGQLGFTVVTGLGGGVCYFVSLLYYFVAIDRIGIGLASATIRMSVALPVVAALVFWHEAL